MRILQLSLFGEHWNILPSFALSPTETYEREYYSNSDYCWHSETITVIGFALPPAEVRCNSCWEDQVPAPRDPSDSSSEWVCSVCTYVCSSCSSRDESNCGNCECCDSCCDCSYCGGCSEMFSSEAECRHCAECSSCCSCQECNRCSNLADCYECIRCEYCGCDCDSEDSDYYGNRDSDEFDPCHIIGIPGSHIGVEIEFEGCNVYRDAQRSSLLSAFAAAGIAVFYSSDHDATSLKRWTLKPDGSVSNGGELVSPPLDWSSASDRQQVRTALQVLRSEGCFPTDSTGIHVHVEAKTPDGFSFDTEQLRNLAVLAIANEDALFRIAASETGVMRSGATSYARCYSTSEFGKVLAATSEGALFSATRGNRYKGLNLQSFPKHGTVEFRYCNSTVNADRLLSQITLFATLRDIARDGFTASDLRGFAMGSSYEGKSEPEEQLQQLQRIVRQDDRMSNEDWNTLVALCWKESASQCSNVDRYAG